MSQHHIFIPVHFLFAYYCFTVYYVKKFFVFKILNSKTNAFIVQFTLLGSQSTPPLFADLDDTLKPLQPLPNSPGSMVVYYQHVKKAEQFIELKKKVTEAKQKV